jgi:hypothetical protein
LWVKVHPLKPNCRLAVKFFDLALALSPLFRYLPARKGRLNSQRISFQGPPNGDDWMPLHGGPPF